MEEAKLNAATAALNHAQAQLDEKEKELDVTRTEYDKALEHKQVIAVICCTDRVLWFLKYLFPCVFSNETK